MEYHILASGSKGNATFIFDQGEGILIDCGISRKQLLYKLSTLHFNEENINYVFLTHDHYDHNKNIGIFNDDIVYCGEGCIKGKDDEHIFVPYNEYSFGHFQVIPLSISHDATSPLAFLIKGEKENILYMTDTGYISQKNLSYMQNLDYYIIESNHDVEMLMATRRPLFLKNRILGDSGHLSNEYSADMMCRVIGEKTKEICLAHLSQEANTANQALQTYDTVFNNHGVQVDKIQVASQVDIVSGGEYES